MQQPDALHDKTAFESNAAGAEKQNVVHSPTHIKEEPTATPQSASPAHHSDTSHQHLPSLALGKIDRVAYTQSPLRESSLPVTSTEVVAPDAANKKKRPAPVRSKKGTATVTKKEPGNKRRKLDAIRSVTPISAMSKGGPHKTGSGKATPLNSSPAPSGRSGSVDVEEESEEEDEGDGEDGDADDGNLYCICRKPDTGSFMIGCDGQCDDWFHGKCMGIAERDKNLIDKYICPKCTEANVGMTTWKRICRRSGCRQPARVGKSRDSKEGSKYCSDECGVLFFRNMLGQTRDNVDGAGRNRNTRRKTDGGRVHEDLGAKGGLLASGEVKTMLDAANRAEIFRRLGDGVLSPPSSPNGQPDGFSIRYTDTEAATLARIAKDKDDARRRHQLLKDRLRFATLAKQAATRVATEKDLKPKEYCGYDARIEWTEATFAEWRDSPAGKQAFANDMLPPSDTGEGDTNFNVDTANHGGDPKICDRRKCARHLEWNKLALDDVRFEMSDNSDNMRALDREERRIRESAALRSRSADSTEQGTVEMHSVSTPIEQNDGVVRTGIPTPPHASAEDGQRQEATAVQSQETGPVNGGAADVVMSETLPAEI